MNCPADATCESIAHSRQPGFLVSTAASPNRIPPRRPDGANTRMGRRRASEEPLRPPGARQRGEGKGNLPIAGPRDPVPAHTRQRPIAVLTFVLAARILWKSPSPTARLGYLANPARTELMKQRIARLHGGHDDGMSFLSLPGNPQQPQGERRAGGPSSMADRVRQVLQVREEVLPQPHLLGSPTACGPVVGARCLTACPSQKPRPRWQARTCVKRGVFLQLTRRVRLGNV